MTTSLYKVNSGDLPLASDIDQYADLFSGTNDVGKITLASPVSAPAATFTAAAASGSGLGIGTYKYVLTYVVGYKKTNGTIIYGGETDSAASVSVTTTSGNQKVTLGSLPTSWPSTVVALRVYRTAVNGSTYNLVTTITTASATYSDTTADASLGVAVTTSNTTGTHISGTIDGINALSHADALTALMHYESSLLTTRGVTGTFTRTSAANDPTTLANVASGTPRYSAGKYGKGFFIEEGTTNLVTYSDFETFTATTTVFFDPLTSGTAWTSQGGSFTYAAGGATCGANSSNITAGNSVWKPLTGSGGQNLALTVQATFTTPTTLSTGSNGAIDLWQDANNKYNVSFSNNTLYLQKQVGGTWTALTQIAFTPATSHTYTITLLLDHTGALTAKLYDGSGTGGTLLQTLSATDTSLTGGFLIGVGGDTGVVISNAGVIAPWADGWTIAGDQRVAWALTALNPISGSFSVSAVGIASGISGYITKNVSVASSQSYTFSGYANSTNLGTTNGAYLELYMTGNTVYSSHIFGTTTNQRYSVTTTTPSTVTSVSAICLINDSGTVVFDAIQLEQKAYATSYLRNDSTSSSATRAAETLTYPATLLTASAGTISVWAYEDGVSRYGTLIDTTNHALMLEKTTASGYYAVYANNTFLGSFSPPSIGLHLVTLAWNGTQVKAYIDGVVRVTYTSSVSFTNVTNMYIGSGTQQWNNVIDELAVFNRALTDAEVYSIYAATQPIIDVFQSDAQTLGGLTKDQVTTNIPNTSLNGPLVSSITAGQNVAVTNPGGVGAATVGLSGVVPVANGGTGSATQNFVDLSTAQTVGGAKTFTGAAALNGGGSIGSGQTLTNNGTISGGTLSGATVSGGTVNPTTLQRGGNTAWDDGNSPKSLAANGYQKFNSGVIMQWGHVSVAANSSTTVTFPLAFPTACGSVTATGNGGNITSGGIFLGSPPTTTTFPVYNSSTTAMDVYWIAIGY